MKVVYVTNSRIPTEKAYGLQTASMCHALGAAGAEVTLVAPERQNDIGEDLFAYYGIEKNFAVHYLPIKDAIGIGRRFGFWVTRLSYARGVKKFLQDSKAVIFTRDLISAVLLKRQGRHVFYDMHGFPYRWVWFWQWACRQMDGIVCTNQWKMDKCEKEFGIPKNKLLLARNGFDNMNMQNIGRDTARNEVNLPLDRRIALYAGHLQDWKGVDVLAAAAHELPHVLFVFVGGTEEEKKQFAIRNPNLSSNIEMRGQVPHRKVAPYLQAADVLVLPNSAKAKDPRFAVYSQYDTSPLKLFEYMSSHRPIVASVLPSIKEVLNENNAVLVEPDNPGALADGINKVLTDNNLAQRISKQAWHDGWKNGYTWSQRAGDILNFIEQRL